MYREKTNRGRSSFLMIEERSLKSGLLTGIRADTETLVAQIIRYQR